MAIYYIGAFPPTYGGVTIKNQYLYQALCDSLPMKKIDMNLVKRGNVRELLRLLWAMATGRQFVIGLAGQKNRRIFTRLMYCFRRSAMGRSILLVMGGVVEDILRAGPEFIRKMDTYRKVYVELPAMAQILTDAGMTNAALYPNARPRPAAPLPVAVGDAALRCVFFSLIQPEKGVDRILAAAKQLPGIQFHFYGSIVPGYRETFLKETDALANAHYHGTFAGDSESVYRQLNQYDVLLLPTRWKAEGLPGILIEAKIAGLASVVSAQNHNPQIVHHGRDGIVLEADTDSCLVQALTSLDRDREVLLNMKLAGIASAEQYYIDTCASQVLNELQRG